MRCPSCEHEVTAKAFCQRCRKSLQAPKHAAVQLQGAAVGRFAPKLLVFAAGMIITAAAIQLPMDYAFAAAADTPVASQAANPAGPSGTPEKPLQGEAGYKQASEKLNRMYAGLDVINKKMDRSLFEIDALADRLGSDPAVMFHFVRDEIRYEPYTGVLRGALGTLLCRAGNSLDRSLLLAALLDKRGFKTQIASGQLTAQQAQILVSRLFESVKPVGSAVPTLGALAPDLMRALGVDKAKLLGTADMMQATGERQRKELVNYVDGETNLLSKLLSKAGVNAGVITPNDQLLAEASDHYWVQYQNSDGQWVDLDSAFTDAEPGKAVVSATDIFAPDSVPEALYHHLQISLTIRVMQIVDGSDGPFSDTVLLDQGLRVSDEQGQDIILANSPVPTPNLMKSGVGLVEALAATKGFQTVLQVGDRVIPGKYFDLEGKVSDTLGGPVGDVVTNAGGIGKSVGGITGGINDVFGGGAPAQNPTRIIGEWVDYQFTSPRPNTGRPMIHTYHRDIVAPSTVKSWTVNGGSETDPTNLGKDALRRRLLWAVELLPVTGAISAEYIGYLQLQTLMQNRQLLNSLSKMASGLTSDQAPPNSSRLPVANNLLSAGTMQIANSLTNAQFPGLRSYFGQAGLIAFEWAGSDSSSLADHKEGYDIVAYEARVVANPASNTENASRAVGSVHIMQGVLATRLEWVLMIMSGAGREANVLNATEVIAAAQEQGVPSIVLRPGAVGLKQLAGLSVPDSIKSELSESLGAGNTLVLPAKAPTISGVSQLAWWRLDDASGELIGCHAWRSKGMPIRNTRAQ